MHEPLSKIHSLKDDLKDFSIGRINQYRSLHIKGGKEFLSQIRTHQPFAVLGHHIHLGVTHYANEDI